MPQNNRSDTRAKRRYEPWLTRRHSTNNYTSIDDRDTRIDNSVHQRIDTDGGDIRDSTHSSYRDDSRTDSHDDRGAPNSSQVEDSHDYEALSS